MGTRLAISPNMLTVTVGLLCIAWTAYELGRISRHAAPARPSGTRAWDAQGRPLEIEEL